MIKNRLEVFPIPSGVATDERFEVRVRCTGEEEWHAVPQYAAWVDMHDVRQTAVGIFDFEGTVEVDIRPNVSWIHSAVVRPLSLGIVPECDGHALRFSLEKPADVMIEVNGERFHCLHLFAGVIQKQPEENTVWLRASRSRPRTTEVRELVPRLLTMPEGRTLAFGPGLHIIDEYIFLVPSGLHVYLAPGAVVVGAFVVENAENIRIDGHGVILQRSFHRFSSINGVRISHSRKIMIEGITFINPPHYTIHMGDSEDVTIRGVRSFSCEGWSDGIDMMSCRRVHVDSCFLRNSDDCIAIYGRRWAYNGDTQDVLVENCTLWADVAHPTNIGTHGDYENDGNIIERITFRNIDILEHHEYQPGYLGCMAINAGDKNIIRDVLYENIRVEHISHGKLIDIQVKANPDYNPAPGKCIEHIVFRNIYCDCIPPVASVIAGYDENHRVQGVLLENVTECGCRTPIKIGPYADDVQY